MVFISPFSSIIHGVYFSLFIYYTWCLFLLVHLLYMVFISPCSFSFVLVFDCMNLQNLLLSSFILMAIDRPYSYFAFITKRFASFLASSYFFLFCGFLLYLYFLYSHYNEQLYTAHPSIYIFIDVIKQIQLTSKSLFSSHQLRF
jgi:hypothetical protein